MKLKIKSDFGIRGIHTATLYDVATEKARKLQARILELSRNPKHDSREYRYLLEKFKDLCGVLQLKQENLITLRGRSVFANILGDNPVYTGAISHGAVGTGSTTPAPGDTALGAEVFRKIPNDTDISDADNGNVIFSFFYNESDFTNSAVREFGTFIDGSATPDSGRIFSRVLFPEAINKTNTKTLTVDSEYAVTSG